MEELFYVRLIYSFLYSFSFAGSEQNMLEYSAANSFTK